MVTQRWDASAQSESFLNEGGVSGLFASGSASTNIYVASDDYSYFSANPYQKGYFHLDKPLTLQITEFADYSGSNYNPTSFQNANNFHITYYLTLSQYEDSDSDGEPDNLIGLIAMVSDELNRYGITKGSKYLFTYEYPLQPGWYYIEASLTMNGKAYQGDSINVDAGMHLSVVPLPSTGILLLPGLFGLVGLKRYLKKA